jgi:hypothetical protein
VWPFAQRQAAPRRVAARFVRSPHRHIDGLGTVRRRQRRRCVGRTRRQQRKAFQYIYSTRRASTPLHETRVLARQRWCGNRAEAENRWVGRGRASLTERDGRAPKTPGTVNCTTIARLLHDYCMTTVRACAILYVYCASTVRLLCVYCASPVHLASSIGPPRTCGAGYCTTTARLLHDYCASTVHACASTVRLLCDYCASPVHLLCVYCASTVRLLCVPEGLLGVYWASIVRLLCIACASSKQYRAPKDLWCRLLHDYCTTIA